MHPNAALLERLFTSLNQHDDDAMASCYDEKAVFHDIAFDLNNRQEIHDMWRMICKGGSHLRAEVGDIHADDRTGRVKVIETYTFTFKLLVERKRPVTNPIESRFVFENGKIIEQEDHCDPRAWAKQAIGGPIGFLAGRLHFVRKRAAAKKLNEFLSEHPAAADSSQPT